MAMTSNLCLLSLGVLATALTHCRFSSPRMAWVANVPFLLFVLRSDGNDAFDASPACPTWGGALLLLLGLCSGHTLAVSKICTQHIPLAMSPMFGVPIGAIHFGGYLLWWHVSSRVDPRSTPSLEWLLPLLFASCMIVAEWFQYSRTRLGSWAAAAYTQVGSLPLLQLASITGLAGPGFLIYWCNGLVALAVRALMHEVKDAKDESTSAARSELLPPFLMWSVLVIIADWWGNCRLDTSLPEASHVTVASVISDSTLGGLPLPSREEIEKNNKDLWARTIRAAQAGAKLVSFTEAATMVLPEDEKEFLSEGRKLAHQYAISVVLSYVVPLQTKPSLLYENKAVWIRQDGTVDHSYLKHEPVPGEPAVKGQSRAPKVVDTTFGWASLAICYDYDFPYLARRHARYGVRLAVVPSSDWRGIDPTHTQMAAVRAIEGGFAVLRTTRMGLSAGIDSCGRMLGHFSANRIARGVEGVENNPLDRILLVTLPLPAKQTGVRASTFYGRHGDWLVYLCIAGLVGVEALHLYR